MPAANSSARTPLFRWISVAVSILLALIGLELVLRIGYFFQHRATPPQSVVDATLGWVAVPGLEISYDKPGYGHVDYSTDEHGFRRSGRLDNDKLRVFAIGDSTTHAVQVSDGKAYFDVLADNEPRLEVFAYGVGGYGPLQQRMAFERHVERIDPDIILWQFCTNDLVNSDWRLEAASTENNNHMTRPFFENDRVVYRHPDGWMGALATRSKLFRRLAVVRGSVLKRLVGSIENELSPEHPDLQRALATMRLVVSGAIESYPERTFVAFSTYSEAPRPFEFYVFDEICKIPGLRCVTGIQERLREAEAAGDPIDGGSDSHWNERGHAIAGNVILDYFRENGLIDRPQPAGDSR